MFSIFYNIIAIITGLIKNIIKATGAYFATTLLTPIVARIMPVPVLNEVLQIGVITITLVVIDYILAAIFPKSEGFEDVIEISLLN